MVQATDIFTLVIRIMVVIGIIFLFIELVFAFEAIVKTNEKDQVSIEIAENMMSSEYLINGKKLTISRAVFDEEALKEILIENSFLEPVRHCRFGATFTFIDLEEDKPVASFGFNDSVSQEFVEKSFYVGLKKKDPINDGYKIVAARMDLRVKESLLSYLTCAAEMAWVSNIVETIDLKSEDVHYTTYVTGGYAVPISSFEFSRAEDTFIITEGDIERRRWLPSEIETVNRFIIDPDEINQIISSKRTIQLLFIPMRKQEFATRGCVDWRENENRQYKPGESDNRIICILHRAV